MKPRQGRTKKVPKPLFEPEPLYLPLPPPPPDSPEVRREKKDSQKIIIIPMN